MSNKIYKMSSFMYIFFEKPERGDCEGFPTWNDDCLCAVRYSAYGFLKATMHQKK
jgi:hypothetical protein